MKSAEDCGARGAESKDWAWDTQPLPPLAEPGWQRGRPRQADGFVLAVYAVGDVAGLTWHLELAREAAEQGSSGFIVGGWGLALDPQPSCVARHHVLLLAARRSV